MADRYFADDPIVDLNDDTLHRAGFAQQIVKICGQAAVQSRTIVMALIGSWGSGKSSVLELVKQSLVIQSDSWRVATFNPWLFSDVESLLQSFFGELTSVLPEDAASEGLRKKIGRYVVNISPAGKLTSLAGFDSSAALQKLGELLQGDPKSTESQRDEIEAALSGLPYKILVVIDDMDRLQPAELLLMFKLIRLIGRLPNIHYLLAYDERTILDVLKRSELTYGDTDERAQDYLQKIVQIRLDLPPLYDEQQDDLFNQGLSKFLESYEIAVSDVDWRRLTYIYNAYIKPHVREPRGMNRLMAQLHAFYGLVANEVEFVDFFALTFIRTFEPSLYRKLPQYRDELTGQLSIRTVNSKDPGQKKAEWRARLEASGVAGERHETMFNLLDKLFPKAVSGGVDKELRPRGVNKVDYFDRYFQFGVPVTDFSDSAILNALSQLPSHDNDYFSVFLDGMVKSPAKVLRKIRHFSDQDRIGNGEVVFDYLAVFYDRIPVTPGIDAPDFLLLDVASSIASRLENDVVKRIVSDKAKSDSTIKFAADFIGRMIANGPSSGSEPDWLAATAAAVSEELVRVISGLGSKSLDDVSDKEFVLIFRLLSMSGDDKTVRDVMWANIENGEWTLNGVLGGLVTMGISSNGARSIMHLDPELVERALGFDRVVDALGDLLGDEPNEAALVKKENPTKEERDAYALASIARMNRQR